MEKLVDNSLGHVTMVLDNTIIVLRSCDCRVEIMRPSCCGHHCGFGVM